MFAWGMFMENGFVQETQKLEIVSEYFGSIAYYEETGYVIVWLQLHELSLQVFMIFCSLRLDRYNAGPFFAFILFTAKRFSSDSPM